MEAENNPEANGSDQPTTKDTADVTQDTPKTNGETTPETLAMSSPAKARYDWYQTETDVIIAIMVKNASPNEVQIEFTEKTVSATIKLPSGSDYSLELDLAHSINVARCRYKVLKTKIEIKMRKVEGLQWTALEAADNKTNPNVKHFQPDSQGSSSAANKYPSSSHYTRNWDKLVSDIKKEEKDEKPEGNEAMNKLLQQIYGDGSDEVRKAMNKSFTESGGTVLSTNWKEVGKEKVEVKPPDGMEYKKYEY